MDRIEKMGFSTIHHGPFNNRVYLMKLDRRDLPGLVERLDDLARGKEYTKIFAKVPADAATQFFERGYLREAMVPGFYNGAGDALFLGKYLESARAQPGDPDGLASILDLAKKKARDGSVPRALAPGMGLISCGPDLADEMSHVFREVFPNYPFPIYNPDYLRETMASHVDYFGIVEAGRIVALSSAEKDVSGANVEMTDFATLPTHRRKGCARLLLQAMEAAMARCGMRMAYTIARAVSPGMNITFAQLDYRFGGTLVNNTRIYSAIESMNVWHKPLSRNSAGISDSA